MQMYNILNVKDIAEFDAWFRSWWKQCAVRTRRTKIGLVQRF